MRIALLSMVALLIITGDVSAKTIVSSTPSACSWTYSPGKPFIEIPDTVNTSGVELQWEDAGERLAGDFRQPLRAFVIAVPPGTTPQLRIDGIHTERRPQGMAGRPSHIPPEVNGLSREWARLVSVNDWRGYQLARVEVYLQNGDAKNSEILTEVSLSVTFSGKPKLASQATRDAEFLENIALNGKDAALWWQPRSPRRTLDSMDAWPAFQLYRLGVEEAGLYSVDGTWLRTRGANFIGQPSSAVKIFGNGGRLLPSLPDAVTDSALQENSIYVNDGGDGVFNETDRIYFYARGVKGFDWADETYLNDYTHQSPFTRENTYFIGVDVGGTPGLRMASLETSGSGQAVETTPGREYVDTDLFAYASGYESHSGLVWYSASMGPNESHTMSINADNALSDSASLRLFAFALGGVGNHFEIWIDNAAGNTRVSSDYFASLPFRVTIPPGVLVPGTNRVRLVNGSGTTIHVNYVELEFTRQLAAKVSPTDSTLEFYSPANQTGLFRYSVQDIANNGFVLDVSDALHPRFAVGNTIVDSAYADAQRTYYAVSGNLRVPSFRGAKATGQGDHISTLRNVANPAGLIILTYDAWFDVLEPLKDFHVNYREEPLPTVRVRLTDVFDEFGWGVRDVVAIRNFLEYAYENWRGEDGNDTLKYVLLVGDGDYDYRNILSSADDNWMPPWEDGWLTNDDFFVIFDSGANALPQLFAGRWPLQSVDEVEAAQNKTIMYATQPLYSPWKVSATFAADDEWKTNNGVVGCYEHDHTIQSENLINNVLPSYFNFNKIYEILYPFRSTPTGPQKPDATEDLLDAISDGTLIVNYAGHGNERIWTDEQLFVMDRDHNRLDNYRMWPMFVAGTCTWGGFDRPTERCFPELLLADARDGAIASMGATRVTTSAANYGLITRFYTEIFRQGLEARRSFGEALTIAKIASSANSKLYHVLGDPVIRLATPERFARVTVRDDSLQALSLFHLSGVVSQDEDGETWTDFNGVVEARIFDTQDSAVYYWPDSQNCDLVSDEAFYYGLPGNAIFRGTASVQNGEFDVTFRVPRDVRYGGTNARISLYFYGKGSEPDSADGIGIEEHILIANEAASELDSVAPSIDVWLEAPSFRSGDVVNAMPLLHIGLADSSGINLSGEVGHRITVRVDDAAPEDFTPSFNYDLDSYTLGSAEKAIGPLTLGEHRLTVEAWDSFNNLNQSSVTFSVGESGEAGYAVRDVLTYPNPMSDQTYFTYSLSQDGTSNVNIRVYTLSGKLVWEGDGFGTNVLFNSNSERPWDGRDREGHELGNGVYFYRVKAENVAGHTAEATGKLVILR